MKCFNQEAITAGDAANVVALRRRNDELPDLVYAARCNATRQRIEALEAAIPDAEAARVTAAKAVVVANDAVNKARQELRAAEVKMYVHRERVRDLKYQLAQAKHEMTALQIRPIRRK